MENSMKSEIVRFVERRYEYDTNGNMVKETTIEGTGDLPSTLESESAKVEIVKAKNGG